MEQRSKNKRALSQREAFSYPGISIPEARIKVATKQTNIALALRRGDLELAERLATALTRSKEARVLAVYRVITNKGYRTKGYKDRKPTTSEEFTQLVDRLW
uniref:Reverse transcriptase N-terminal domain-containing protein n=1 Tax=Pseudopediastrum sp. CL0201VA TaxID=2184484 RepID=A0A2U8GJY1_9CHLO|nr:hypothetical protein [Pseudopediastrum sp. CL0201VA]AWI68925.1 hypothetical protein [Pseudopediastrum sp. CL0201VA]